MLYRNTLWLGLFLKLWKVYAADPALRTNDRVASRTSRQKTNLSQLSNSWQKERSTSFHPCQPLRSACSRARVTHCSLDPRDSGFVGHEQNSNALEENNLRLDPTAPFEVGVRMFISLNETQIRSLFRSQQWQNRTGCSTSSFANHRNLWKAVSTAVSFVRAAAAPPCSLQPYRHKCSIICIPP